MVKLELASYAGGLVGALVAGLGFGVTASPARALLGEPELQVLGVSVLLLGFLFGHEVGGRATGLVDPGPTTRRWWFFATVWLACSAWLAVARLALFDRGPWGLAAALGIGLVLRIGLRILAGRLGVAGQWRESAASTPARESD